MYVKKDFNVMARRYAPWTIPLPALPATASARYVTHGAVQDGRYRRLEITD